MRLIQICVDAIDDLVSFAQAVNNWPGLIISGALSLTVVIAVSVVAPWVFIILMVLAALGAGVWAIASVMLSGPAIRPRIVGLHLVAFGLAVFAMATIVWPELVAGLRSATFLAAVLATISAFVAHEVARELSLAV